MREELQDLQEQVATLRAQAVAAAGDRAYLASMERVGRVLRGTRSLEPMLEAALDEVLSIFDCDRAWLLFPCDPEAPSWGVPKERTSEEWPGVFALGVSIPMDEGAASVFREALATDAPLPYDPTTERQVPEEIGKAFAVASQMAIAIRPSVGKPWLLGLHHCGEARVYSDVDQRIFAGIARLMGDALDTALLLQDLRETQQRLTQLSRSENVGTLAAGVAHDFCNKLVVIIGYAEMLREMGGDEQFVEQILDASDSATELTRELLAFSRRAVLEPRPVDLTSAAMSIGALLRRALGGAIQLNIDGGRDRTVAHVDPAQLEQVLVNLVLNARDALPEGGTITVSTRARVVEAGATGVPSELTSGEYITLTVADDGVGMEEDTLAQVFEPFFTTKERGKGTGLGLSTAFGVARQSGGALTVASEPGVGSTFTLWLPATDEPTVDTSGSFRPVTLAGGDEAILLVEADDEVATLTSRVLGSRGYQVTRVATAAEALDRLGEGPYDLLLTEVLLADSDGVALVDSARAVQPELAVTFTTAYSGDAIERLVRAGLGKRILQKPYSPTDLLGHVRSVLDG